MLLFPALLCVLCLLRGISALPLHNKVLERNKLLNKTKKIQTYTNLHNTSTITHANGFFQQYHPQHHFQLGDLLGLLLKNYC